MAASGILGFSGIAVGAAGAHEAGGELARLASLYLLIHAAAVIGIAAWADRAGRSQVLALIAATMLVVGSASFSGDLAVLAFTGSHILRGLAPFGGSMLMAGWLLFTGSAVRSGVGA